MANCDDLIRDAEREKDPTKKSEIFQRAIVCLNKVIKEQNSKIQDYKAPEFADRIGKTLTDMKETLTDFDKMYRLGEDISRSIKSTALNIGVSAENSRLFEKNFKSAYYEVSKFGGTIEDVASAYQDMADESGRGRFITDEEVANITKLEKITGDRGDQVAKMYENFQLMGMSSEVVSKNVNELMMDSQKIGLNSKKVLTELTNNFGKLQSYSFANGIKGMTEMAKQAVKMRMDVSQVLSMAEKFYQPEAAIEAAAELQLLGGDIASAFGDPFTVMYEARNKPEELAKRVQQMTENMLQFNEETGQYDLPPEAKMQFDALSKSIGLGSDELIKMSRESAKLKDIKTELSGSMFSEEEMEAIANFSRMEDGEFKVDIPGLDPKNIKDLQESDLELLMKMPEDEEDYMDKMIYESQTTNQILENVNKNLEAGVLIKFDTYSEMEKLQKPAFKGIQDVSNTILENVSKQLESQGWSDIGSSFEKAGLGTIGEVGDSIKNMFTSFEKTVSDIGLEGIKNELKDATITATNVNLTEVDNNKNLSSESPEQNDFLSRNDGTLTSFSSMDDVIGAKSGGPIDKLLSSVLQNNNNNNNNNNNSGIVEVKGNPKIDININSNNPNMNFTTEQMNKITSVALTSILSVFNNGGSVDGGSQSQTGKGFAQNLGNYKK